MLKLSKFTQLKYFFRSIKNFGNFVFEKFCHKIKEGIFWCESKFKIFQNRSRFKRVIFLGVSILVTGFFTVRAVFQEPTATPSSSDQDFAENILGAKNNNNDYASSSVVANENGSVIEKLEYIIDFFYDPSCGNGAIEGGESCDDAGVSWTSGVCAGDCSRRNYWSNPSVAGVAIGAGTFSLSENINRYCQQMGFNKCTSYGTNTGVGSRNFKFLGPTSLLSSSTVVGSQSTSAESTTSGTTSSSHISYDGTSSYYYTYEFFDDLSYVSPLTYYRSVSYYSTFWENGWKGYESSSSIMSSSYTFSTEFSWASAVTLLTSSFSTTTASSSGVIYYLHYSSYYYGRSFFYISSYTISSTGRSFIVFQPSTSVIISEIWCAD